MSEILCRPDGPGRPDGSNRPDSPQAFGSERDQAFGPERLRVVLARPLYPGNVGAVARAMGNMGLTDLALVAPCDHLSEEARRMASNAGAILEGASVHATLAEALEGTSLAMGTTARTRRFNHQLIDLREAHTRLPGKGKVALVFGNEKHGLDNEELSLCAPLLTIPTYSEYHSLNLSQAVMVALFELSRHFGAQPDLEERALADLSEVEGMRGHLFAVLEQIGFFKSEDQRQSLKVSLADLVGRMSPTSRDLALIRGILRRVQVSLKRAAAKNGDFP